MTLRLLAVHAHPDDESSKGAATYAAYRARGVEVMVVSCTGGERGSVLNEDVARRAMADRDIAGLRRLEMAEAQAAMGIQHRWLGYVDSGLPENGEALPANCFALTPLEFSAAPLVAVLREFRPQVVVTYDENGGYPHPDHIRTHEVTMRAIDAAADAAAYPEAGAPWAVQKVYYERIFNAPKLVAIHAVLSERDPQNPRLARLAELTEWMAERPDSATTRVPVGDFLDTRDAALRSHASQVAPDDEFFFWPNDLQREAWPFEDYELVRSTVDSVQPEDDLFAGIPQSQPTDKAGA